MKKSLEELKDEYYTHAHEHGAYTIDGDYKNANKSYDKLISILNLIREYGNDGGQALLELARETDESVACWAATHSLKYNELEALGVLSKIASKGGVSGFNAKVVLRQWNSGDLIIP